MIKKNTIIYISATVLVAAALVIVLLLSSIQQNNSVYSEPSEGENQTEVAYQFSESLYMMPFLSFMPTKESMSHFVYWFDENELRIVGTANKRIDYYKFSDGPQKLTVQDIEDKIDFSTVASDLHLSSYKQISRQASYVKQGKTSERYDIYRADREVWLVRVSDDSIFNIYLLEAKSDFDISAWDETFAVIETGDTVYGATFPIGNHMHKFEMNDEVFVPDDKFMCTIETPDYLSLDSVFFAKDLIMKQLEIVDKTDIADQIEQEEGINYAAEIIGGRDYICAIDLEQYFNIFIGWEFSSHTPVNFSTLDYMSVS